MFLLVAKDFLHITVFGCFSRFAQQPTFPGQISFYIGSQVIVSDGGNLGFICSGGCSDGGVLRIQESRGARRRRSTCTQFCLFYQRVNYTSFFLKSRKLNKMFKFSTILAAGSGFHDDAVNNEMSF